MKRFLTLALAGALVLGVGSVAYANVCAFDPAPAATLLFPFVSYNYDAGANGYNTLMAITNVSADAQIAHVTLWTDYSTAILDWNILLTGYDVVTFDIRTILENGQLPITVSDPLDPDYISGGGVFSDGPWSENNELVEADIPIPFPDPPLPEETDTLNCLPSAEAYPGRFRDEQIDEFILGFFQEWLTASQAGVNYFNDCTGSLDDNYQIPGTWWTDRGVSDDTWMYITVDVVDVCRKSFPDSPTYFVDPASGGEALPDNVLIGDVIWVDRFNRFSEIDNAVHLEADTAIGAVATTNLVDPRFPVTFYSRYSNPNDVSDYREPLPTAWAMRYTYGTLGDGTVLKTYIRAFKTTVGANLDDLIVVGFLPPDELVSLNCVAYTLYAWDDDEQVISAESADPWSRPGTAAVVVENLLPLETQEVDAEQFTTVDNSGWFLFVWPWSNVQDPAIALHYQTWMGVKYVAEGLYSGFRSGAVMANWNCFDDQILPDLGVNYDYVSGF
jgi:hypothetical protein